MVLEDLGYSDMFENFRQDHNLTGFGVGRVISQHRERYIISAGEKEYEGEVIGNLRYSIQSMAEFPAVGDWVAISEYDENKALIHAVFPRKTLLERQAVGKQGEKQVIATNIDYAMILQAVDRDFSINRLERYLTLCYNAGVRPVIILNKIDLISDEALSVLTSAIKARLKDVPFYSISNETGDGIAQLAMIMEKGKTYCLLGSSGVGKSTLLNNLSTLKKMKTSEISSSTSRGKHVTTHRELVVLDNGSILIDNPGMREVGMTDVSAGLESTFQQIETIAEECRFRDCTHRNEIGCAVTEALNAGLIDQDSYDNYLKMNREKDFYESTVSDRRKKDKAFGKMVKQFKNIKKNK
jgi:ribosome biogenesis GTPase